MAFWKPHSAVLQGNYNLDVKKPLAVPLFLSQLYQAQPTPTLYLVTAKPKIDPGWPPIVREEFIFDLERGLLVAHRKYWRGEIGSGREEELATTDVMTHWTEYPGSLYVPAEGWTEQLVDEFTEQGPTHRRVRGAWRVEIVTLNEPLDSSLFDLEGYLLD